MQDCAYQSVSFASPLLKHHYGERVHLLHDPLLLGELALLCANSCVQPQITALVRALYRALVRHVIAASWPRHSLQQPTRMAAHTEQGVWHGQVVNGDIDTVVVDIARAGTVPAQIAFDTLNQLFASSVARIRQDHLSMARQTDAQGAVTGVSVDASKIGGQAEGAYVLIPDPMGATGTSMAKAISLYKQLPGGAPAKIMALHLIVTPEYLATMRRSHPDVDIWALRLDRGMSPAAIFHTVPGERWAEERGLNEQQYIVPGAGGLGELLNNAEH